MSNNCISVLCVFFLLTFISCSGDEPKLGNTPDANPENPTPEKPGDDGSASTLPEYDAPDRSRIIDFPVHMEPAVIRQEVPEARFMLSLH